MPLPTFDITCTKNELIANGVYEITFTKPADFHFKTGQFVMIDVPLLDDPSDIQPRAYSIASTPEEEELLFVIKLKEGGRASNWVEKELKTGTQTVMQGPLGVFCLKQDENRDHVLVCTSTGVAPFRAFIKDAADHDCAEQIDLIFGVRSEEDIFWTEELKHLAEGHDNIRVHLSLTRPGESWTGLHGRVQTIIQDIIPDFSNKNVYICGNPDMVDEVKALCLGDCGLVKENVFMEGFV